MKDLIKGKAFVCGDYVLAYSIIPEKHWYEDRIAEDTMGPWAFEEFGNFDKPYGMRDAGYNIVVAGEGFGGGGKSIEHPILAMKGAGIQIVFAESFARYNFRNSIDKGLPVIQVKGISKLIKKDDSVSVDMNKGIVKNERTGEFLSFEPFAPFIQELLDAGGLIEYTKIQLEKAKHN